MHTIFQGYTMLTSDTPTFFAGANTGNGFVGAYDTFANEEDKGRVWILKGGSGTGKSTLMRKIAGEAKGGGHTCVQYLCSSDPTSLDAVVIDGQYVILDGTAPHVREMAYPGAVSEIVYLGKYWDAVKLTERREKIIGLTQAKKKAYQKGYGVLAAVSALETETYTAALELLNVEKLRGWGERLLKNVPKSARFGGCTTVRTWAISMRGLYRTDGLADGYTQHWKIEDTYCTAPCLFGILAELCEENHIPVVLSLHPINDRVVEIGIPALSLHLSLAEDTGACDKTICMQRFLRKDLPSSQKGTIRLTSRCMVDMLSLAVEHFAVAGEQHMALEEIYKLAMDFTKLQRDLTQLQKQILGGWAKQ